MAPSTSAVLSLPRDLKLSIFAIDRVKDRMIDTIIAVLAVAASLSSGVFLIVVSQYLKDDEAERQLLAKGRRIPCRRWRKSLLWRYWHSK